MSFRYDSPCGLYCGACGTVMAVQTNTVEEQAKKWGMKPEEIICHGCLSEATSDFCQKCHFKDCVEKKGIDYCYECDDFPCRELKDFCSDKWPHHSVVIRNSERMREIGVEKWLEEQKQRWTCQECGEKFMWYDNACRKCGAEVKNAESEHEDLQKESN